MVRDLEQETRQWLAAEAAGETERAESALRRAFVQLPDPPVPAGFTDRVMARVAEQAARDPFATRRVRAAIVAAYLAAAALLLAVGQTARLLLADVRPPDVLDLVSQVAAAAGRALPAVVSAAEGLVADLGVLSLVTAGLLTTPMALAAVFVLTLFCAGALRLIRNLSRSGGTSHADVL